MRDLSNLNESSGFSLYQIDNYLQLLILYQNSSFFNIKTEKLIIILLRL